VISFSYKVTGFLLRQPRKGYQNFGISRRYVNHLDLRTVSRVFSSLVTLMEQECLS